jgi:phosphoribosylpyrophosphate synthetase
MYYISYPYTDQDVKIHHFTFPGGEPHVQLDVIPDDKVFITYNALGWEEFGNLVVLLNAVSHQQKKITLAIPYFPPQIHCFVQYGEMEKLFTLTT